jgi:hypothetical protein
VIPALLTLALLVGCRCGPAEHSGETAEPQHTGESPPDSAADTDPPNGTILVLPSVPEDTSFEGDARVSLVHVVFGEGPRMGETVASEPLSLDGVRLALPWPVPEEDAVDLSPQQGIEGALYALVAHRDDNADGAFDEGERLLGVAMDRWLLLVHSLEEDHERVVVNTWRIVDLGIAGQYEPNRCALDSSWPLEWMSDQGFPVYAEWSEPIALPLRGLEAQLGLELPLVGLVRDDLRFAVLPYPHLNHQAVQPLLDQSLEAGQGSVGGTLDSEPPAADDVGSDPDWRYTMHLLLPYLDSDGSGGWSTADEVEGASACWQGELAWARYTRAVHSYRGYRFLDCYGGTVGWRPVHYADHGGIGYLSSAQAQDFVLDFADCRLD